MNTKKGYFFGIVIGILLGTAIMGFFAMWITKSYGLTLQEYQEINALKDQVESEFYQSTKKIDFVDGMKKGIVESLNDPYSKYLNEKEFKEMMESATGEFVGIGVHIAPTKENTILVISPIKGSPADKAGIRSGDIIVSVNGKKYDADHMQEAVNAMRGKLGEKVSIGILDTNKVEKTFTIIKEDIHPETVVSKVMEKNIGYIGIQSFQERTASEFKKNVEKMKKQNVKGLIIDLRFNGGGLVDQVVDIADQILGKGTIVYTNNKKNEKQYYKSDDKEKITLPIVVITNEYSASASEILAGALQDNKVAKIVGQKTYGKGVIQSILEFHDGGGLVLTTAQYYTPNGHIVHEKGIQPDVEVLSEENKGEKDAQLDKAIEVLKKDMEKK